VTDAANTSRPELKSHQRARDTLISAADGTQGSTSNNINTPTGTRLPTASTFKSTSTKRKKSTTIEDVDDEESPNGELSH
jgi:hypothetical protein